MKKVDLEAIKTIGRNQRRRETEIVSVRSLRPTDTVIVRNVDGVMKLYKVYEQF
jgi:hypothetical protein